QARQREVPEVDLRRRAAERLARRDRSAHRAYERREVIMAQEPDLAELIRFLAVNLVDKPDEVHVELVEERSAHVYELEVAESDLGKVIGRGGKTARALRTVVQAVAPRSRKRTLVEILE